MTLCKLLVNREREKRDVKNRLGKQRVHKNKESKENIFQVCVSEAENWRKITYGQKRKETILNCIQERHKLIDQNIVIL